VDARAALTMLERFTQLTLDELVRLVIGPLVLLQIFIVGFYIIWVMRTWPQMPRREAILYVPLGIPISFVCFFVATGFLAGGKPPTDFAGILALVALLTWLPGIPVAVIAYRAVSRRRSNRRP
jgi:CDP-diglyceride synthetase